MTQQSRKRIQISFLMLAVIYLFICRSGEAVSTSNLPIEFQAPTGVVQLEGCIAGLGEIWGKPANFPLGPVFTVLDGRLLSVQFTVSQADFSSSKTLVDLQSIYFNRELPVQHVDIVFNSPHPGINFPHYHIALYLTTHKQHQGINCR